MSAVRWQSAILRCCCSTSRNPDCQYFQLVSIFLSFLDMNNSHPNGISWRSPLSSVAVVLLSAYFEKSYKNKIRREKNIIFRGRFSRKILLNDYDFWQFSTHPWYMRVCGKLRKLEKNEF